MSNELNKGRENKKSEIIEWERDRERERKKERERERDYRERVK